MLNSPNKSNTPVGGLLDGEITRSRLRSRMSSVERVEDVSETDS